MFFPELFVSVPQKQLEHPEVIFLSRGRIISHFSAQQRRFVSYEYVKKEPEGKREVSSRFAACGEESAPTGRADTLQFAPGLVGS